MKHLNELCTEYYEKGLQGLKSKPGFEKIDLTLVECWATGYAYVNHAIMNDIDITDNILDILSTAIEIEHTLGLPPLELQQRPVEKRAGSIMVRGVSYPVVIRNGYISKEV